MAKYCSKCGTELKEGNKFCPNCGASSSTTGTNSTYNVGTSQYKSKLAGGLLGIFLGSLGIHNFYLGYNQKAVTQLLLTLIGWIACGIGPIIAGIWGLVEGIQILTGAINTDADGNPLVD